MIFQRFVIGTELLAIWTKIASTVDMLGLNVLVEVSPMTSTVLAVETHPVTIISFLHPRQDLSVTVLPPVFFKMINRKLYFIFYESS